MNPMLAKLMSLKKGKRIIPKEEAEGKMSAVTKLSDLAQEPIGKKLSSMKKVTVAADSEEGLKKGLNKAKEIVEEEPMDEMVKNEMLGDEEQEICPCDESSSLEELDAEIQRLMALKAEKETSEEV